MKVERKGSGTGRKKKKKPSAGDLPPPGAEGAVDSRIASTEQTGGSAAKFVKVNKGKSGKFTKEEVRDRSGAVVEEGEALFQGFRVTKEDQKRLQTLYRVRISDFYLSKFK